MNIISGKFQSTINALSCLARHEHQSPLNVSDIADETGLSISYVEQCFALMREQKLVEGVRGPGGGYILTRPAESITLGDICNGAPAASKKLVNLELTLKEIVS